MATLVVKGLNTRVLNTKVCMHLFKVHNFPFHFTTTTTPLFGVLFGVW